jgi:para-aminobenzoate synthetase component 1
VPPKIGGLFLFRKTVGREEAVLALTSFEMWKGWSARYTLLPYVERYPLQEDRLPSLEPAWRRAGSVSFVLESGKDGRYTFLGLEPVSVIRGKGKSAVIADYGSDLPSAELAGFVWMPITPDQPDLPADDAGRQPQPRTTHVWGEPLQLVRLWMSVFRSPRVEGAPKFVGGCVGYWGYDVARSIERLPERARDDLGLPDYYWAMVRELWIVDHTERQLYCAVHKRVPAAADGAVDEAALQFLYDEAAARADAMFREWENMADEAKHDRALLRRQLYETAARKDGLSIDVESIPGLVRAFDKTAFVRAVRDVQRYIAQGDVFQVNLSVRQSRPLSRPPEDVYEWLRLMNPSPYMGLLRFPDLHLVSASPELLVRAVDGVLETRPIAGTRPRGRNAEEDRRLADELIRNGKERAEHIMLVDLLRNDLGRVSRYGTVRVAELMAIEYYSHVMHIVSHIGANWLQGATRTTLSRRCFPAARSRAPRKSVRWKLLKNWNRCGAGRIPARSGGLTTTAIWN